MNHTKITRYTVCLLSSEILHFNYWLATDLLGNKSKPYIYSPGYEFDTCLVTQANKLYMYVLSLAFSLRCPGLVEVHVLATLW